MINAKISNRVKEVYQIFKRRLASLATKEKLNLSLQDSSFLAYQLVGKKTQCALPLFRDLNSNLQRAGLNINLRAYVSLTLLTTIMTSLAVVVFVPCALALAFHLHFLPAILFGIGGSLFTAALSIIGFYVYPVYRADKVRRELEDELPFATGYMSILASAGVSPERIFHSISRLKIPLAISEQARNVVRDVNLFGLDILSALEKTSKRSPSQRLREMLEGFISTIHSGGNLAAYLHQKSKEYMQLKRICLNKFSDTLSVLSEVYVAILVAGPLLLVIMLAIMAMLGGGSLGMLSPDLLLSILTYLGIPLGSVMFLIVLDAVSPKW